MMGEIVGGKTGRMSGRRKRRKEERKEKDGGISGWMKRRNKVREEESGKGRRVMYLALCGSWRLLLDVTGLQRHSESL